MFQQYINKRAVLKPEIHFPFAFQHDEVTIVVPKGCEAILKRRFSIWLLAGLAVLLFLGLGEAYFRFYLGPKLAEQGLEKLVQASLGQTATVERAIIHWLGRPGIEYRGLTIRKAGAQTGWLSIERVLLRPRVASLFSKSIRWKRLDLHHPVVRLAGGRTTFPLESVSPLLSQFDHLRVSGGEIRWPEREIRDLSVSIRNLTIGRAFSLVSKGAITVGEAPPGRFSVDGLVRPPSEGDGTGPRLSGEIEVEELDPLWFRDGFARFMPPGLVGSRLALTARFDGNLNGRFQSSGTVSLTGFPTGEETSRLSADFALSWNGDQLGFEEIRLRAPFLPLEGKGRVYWKGGADPWISFQVNCPWVSIGKGGRTLPFLPENVRSFLESIEQGEVTLVSVGFTGPLRSLGFPGDEESLLHWSGGARFRNVIVPWNGEFVKLESGSVKLDHDNVVAKAIGFHLDGAKLEIPRLSLSRPFSDRSIDLTLTGQVALTDISKWISMGLIPEEVAAPLSHIEVLSGTGDVNLRVEKSLGLVSPPAFNGQLVLQDVTVRTPYLPGTFKRLRGVVDFSSKDLVLRDVQGRWRGSTVSANGSISALSSVHPEADFSLKGSLDLKGLTELSSWEGIPSGTRAVLQEIGSPSGEGDYVLTVRGPLGVSGGMDVKGQLSVRNGSTRLWNAYPVQGISGRILLTRQGISIPQLRGQWKNSNLALEASLETIGGTFLRDLTFSARFDLGDISAERFDHGLPRIWKRYLRPYDFRKGKALLEVTNRKRGDRDTVEGDVYFEDATVHYPPVFPPLSSVMGTVSFSEKGLGALNVQGRFNSSLVTIHGDMAPDPEDSVPSLFIQADEIDWEEVLSWPWSKGVSHGKKGRFPLKVHVQVDRGSFREIRLSDVEATLSVEADRVSFEKVIFGSASETCVITGWLMFEKDDELSFELQPYLINLEVSPILASFQREGSKRQLTGLGSGSGAIRGSGNGVQEIARSLNGEVRLFLQDGWLNQFNVLSKVFSILDLSQLFTGHLPDLKTEGMHYRTITGRVTLKDGRASTSDLLLDSESMKISAVGSLDIPSGSLDLRLALRPVGVGGKIVSRVPFFGEIVTDEGGSFLHYYLEVKGTVAEPEVKGVPLESVRAGVFGPLQRLFEKPLDWLPLQRHPNFDRYFEEREYHGAR